jgi:hypothetical protein
MVSSLAISEPAEWPAQVRSGSQALARHGGPISLHYLPSQTGMRGQSARGTERPRPSGLEFASAVTV